MNPNGRTVFVDTVAWLALVNRSDRLHNAAVRTNRKLLGDGARYITTDAVLAEVGNALARPPMREPVIRFLGALVSSPRLRIVFADRRRFERALRLYSDRPDKEWGLTDCISFTVMGDEHLQQAFTSDRHFQQAGFTCLLTPP